MLAVIGSRLALNFSATSKLSHELSRAYMAVCYGVEASRNMSVVGYPSEPVLALASQELMRRDAFSWKNISAHVIQSLQNGWVEEGPRGEFAWQIMAAEAWDRCTADDETARITGASIGNFFRALIGPDNVKKIEEQASECGSADKLDAVFRAPTHFLQFVEVESSPTIEKLLVAFNRGAHVKSKDNQSGCDFASASYVSSPTDPSLRYVSPFLTSVKNVRNPSKRAHHLNAPLFSSAYYSGICDETVEQDGVLTELMPHPYLVLHVNLHLDQKPAVDFVDSYGDAVGKEIGAKRAQDEAKKLAGKKPSKSRLVLPSKNQVCISLRGFDASVYPSLSDEKFFGSMTRLLTTRIQVLKLEDHFQYKERMKEIIKKITVFALE